MEKWPVTEEEVETTAMADNKMTKRVFEVHILSHLVLGQHDMAIKTFEKSKKVRTLGHGDHTHFLGLIHDRSARDAMWSPLEKLYKHVMLHIWEGQGTFPIEFLSEMPVVAQWAAKRNIERLSKNKNVLQETKLWPSGPFLPASKRLIIAVVSGHGFASRGSTSALMSSLAHRDQNTMSVRCFDGSPPDPLGQVVGVTNRQCDLIESVFKLNTDEFAERLSLEKVHILLVVNGANPGQSKWDGLLKLRPAPILATAMWGVPNVDLFATDAIRAPPEYANHHTTKLLHVPTHPFLCMRPPIKTEEPRSGSTISYLPSPPIAYSLLSIPCSVFPFLYSMFHIPCSPFPIPFFLFPFLCFLFPLSLFLVLHIRFLFLYSLFPISCSLSPIPCFPLPTFWNPALSSETL